MLALYRLGFFLKLIESLQLYGESSTVRNQS